MNPWRFAGQLIGSVLFVVVVVFLVIIPLIAFAKLCYRYAVFG